MCASKNAYNKTTSSTRNAFLNTKRRRKLQILDMFGVKNLCFRCQTTLFVTFFSRNLLPKALNHVNQHDKHDIGKFKPSGSPDGPIHALFVGRSRWRLPTVTPCNRTNGLLDPCFGGVKASKSQVRLENANFKRERPPIVFSRAEARCTHSIVMFSQLITWNECACCNLQRLGKLFFLLRHINDRHSQSAALIGHLISAM